MSLPQPSRTIVVEPLEAAAPAPAPPPEPPRHGDEAAGAPREPSAKP